MTLNLDMFFALASLVLGMHRGFIWRGARFLSHAECAEFAENTRAIASVCHPARSLARCNSRAKQCEPLCSLRLCVRKIVRERILCKSKGLSQSALASLVLASAVGVILSLNEPLGRRPRRQPKGLKSRISQGLMFFLSTR